MKIHSYSFIFHTLNQHGFKAKELFIVYLFYSKRIFFFKKKRKKNDISQ